MCLSLLTDIPGSLLCDYFEVNPVIIFVVVDLSCDRDDVQPSLIIMFIYRRRSVFLLI